MKKNKGEVQQFFIQMIGIIFAFAIMLYGVYYSKTIIVYNNANQIARKYILRMESNGFLSDTDIQDLKTEASKAGMYDVSVTASGEAHYGDKVTLTIDFNEKIKKIDFSDFNLGTEEESAAVSITKSSVAKYFNTR